MIYQELILVKTFYYKLILRDDLKMGLVLNLPYYFLGSGNTLFQQINYFLVKINKIKRTNILTM